MSCRSTASAIAVFTANHPIAASNAKSEPITAQGTYLAALITFDGSPYAGKGTVKDGIRRQVDE